MDPKNNQYVNVSDTHDDEQLVDNFMRQFCVINCDDFYNRDAFMVIGKYLSELPEDSTNK